MTYAEFISVIADFITRHSPSGADKTSLQNNTKFPEGSGIPSLLVKNVNKR
jgi:hypothetical protein